MQKLERNAWIEDNIDKIKELGRQSGLSGEFDCPSCLRRQPCLGAVRQEESSTVICEECFRCWAELAWEERVHQFSDIIPAPQHH